MTRQRIEALLDKPITGALSVLMGLLFLASLFSSHVVGQVALVVSKTFMSNFYVWNIITGNLLETNILKLVPCIAGVLHFGSQAEKALGPIRYAQFLAVVLVGCGAAASAYVFLHFVLSRSETILFRPFHGPGGLVAGLAVAAALPPDPRAPPPPPPPPRLLPRAQLMPLVICGVWTLGAVLWIGCARDALFAWAGFYLGWAYLRFVDPRPDGAHGDTSRHFEVAAFFPEATRRFIQPLCNFCYGVMILLGFFKDRKVPLPKAFGAPGGGEVQHHSGAGGGDDDDDEEAAAAAAGGGFLGLDGPSAGGGGGGGGGLLPPARRADPASERRRARAMKLLDAKFAELAQREGEGAWGDEDGGISATTGQAGKHSEELVGEDASSSSPPELITAAGIAAATSIEKLLAEALQNRKLDIPLVIRPINDDREHEYQRHILPFARGTLNLVVVLSKKVFESPWCQIEMVQAIELQTNIEFVKIHEADFSIEDSEAYVNSLTNPNFIDSRHLEILCSQNMELVRVKHALKIVIEKLRAVSSEIPHICNNPGKGNDVGIRVWNLRQLAKLKLDPITLGVATFAHERKLTNFEKYHVDVNLDARKRARTMSSEKTLMSF